MTIQEAFPKGPTTELTFEMKGENLIVQYTDTKKYVLVDGMKIGGFGCQFRIFPIMKGYEIEFNEPSNYLKAQVKRVKTEPNRVMRWNTVKADMLIVSEGLIKVYTKAAQEVWQQCKQTPKSFTLKGINFGRKNAFFGDFNDWPECLENYEEMLENMKNITDEELKTAVYENL